MKKCYKCKKYKPLSYFHKNKNNKDGYSQLCKLCMSEYSKLYYVKNKSKIDIKNALWYDKNRKHHNKKRLEWYYTNKELCRKNGRLWEESNKEKRRVLNRRADKKKRSNPIFRMTNSISRKIRKSIANKGNTYWEKLVPFTLPQLKKHLENNFKEGMTWDNYGKWHIDHIIPVSFFEFNSYDSWEFKYCWSLDNLQPLWAKDNISKGNNIFERN